MTSTRRRHRLLAAALAGTPLVVVPAWAVATSQRSYEGNHVVSGSAAPAPAAAPAPSPTPAPIVLPVSLSLPAPVAPAPAPAAPAPEPAPAPAPTAPPPLVAVPPLTEPVVPEVPVLPIALPGGPPIDWAALEQLAAALLPPVDPSAGEPSADPVDVATFATGLLP